MRREDLAKAQEAHRLYGELKSWKKVEEALDMTRNELRRLRKDYDAVGATNVEGLGLGGDETRLSRVNVFISYRHADEDAATCLSDAFASWGVPQKQIFQSGRIDSGGIPAGGDIEENIQAAIRRANLFIHVFSKAAESWDWVSREIGFAEAQEKPPTIVTFQLFDDEPPLRTGKVRIPLEQREIERFVRSFFAEPSYLPGFESALWPPPAEAHRKSAQEKFFKDQSGELFQGLEAARDGRQGGDADQDQKVELEDLKIFISCRGADVPIGQAVLERLESWGCELGTGVRISPVAAGDDGSVDVLDSDTVQFLWQCHLVIAIFTEAAADYGRVGYELGTANDPRIATRIITLQVLPDTPSRRFTQWTSSEVVDATSREAIGAFVRDFWCRPRFFPRVAALHSREGIKPADASARGGWYQSQSATMFEELAELRHGYGTDRQPEPAVIESRWGFFSLKIDGALMRPFLEKPKRDDSATGEQAPVGADDKVDVRQVLRDNLVLVGGTKWGVSHFGYTNRDEALHNRPSLGQLVEEWRGGMGEREVSQEAPWADELINEIWAFRRGSGGFNLSWKPVLSANPEVRSASIYFYPVVTQVHIHEDGSRQYDIHTFIMNREDRPAKEGEKELGAPAG